jgi:hypothetical protein
MVPPELRQDPHVSFTQLAGCQRRGRSDLRTRFGTAAAR